VTLYWHTDTFARSIYPYRQISAGQPVSFHANPTYHFTKPFGYSYFPKEIAPIPKDWVATTGNMVWFRAHDAGGHFAALEKPKEFLQDVEDFIEVAWPLTT
jgi:microsomal epoxide hydrolase